METDYIDTSPHRRWTFDDDSITDWVLSYTNGVVLNACCGLNKIPHDDKVIRNDLDPEMDADFHLDVAELSGVLDESSVDTVIFDPPWSVYQSNLRYDGRHVTKDGRDIDVTELPIRLDPSKQQIGHARLAKEGFDYVLRDGGVVIQLAYTGACMPARLGYDRTARVMFDPHGEGKTMIGSVDTKVQKTL